MDTIELEIPDQNIDIEGEWSPRRCHGGSHQLRAELCAAVPLPALQVAFGSLYRDDVLIKPGRVVALLAAACMLQLVSSGAFPAGHSGTLLQRGEQNSRTQRGGCVGKRCGCAVELSVAFADSAGGAHCPP